jgi:hypothetical protein
MIISEFINFLETLRQTEKTEYAKNAHKPFASYAKLVKVDGTLEDIYKDIRVVYKKFVEAYASTTVRNYMRFLQASLNLEKVKGALTASTLENAKKEIQEVLRECDKQVHVDKSAPNAGAAQSAPNAGAAQSTPSIQDSETDASIHEDNWSLNEITPLQDNDNPPQQHDQTQELFEAQRQVEIYKAQLECMWRLLELIYK